MTSKNHIFAATVSASIVMLGAQAMPAQAFLANNGNTVASYAPPAVTERAPPNFRRPAAQSRVPQTASRTATTPEATDLATKATGPADRSSSRSTASNSRFTPADEAIAHSRVSSGVRGRSTPTGVFSIIQKDRWHRSNLYDDAPMWFMQRITWSGVALHQGDRAELPGLARLHPPARGVRPQLWTTTKIGARVIVAHGNVTPTEIAHPKLFTPKRAPVAPVMTQAQSLKAAEQAWSFAQLSSKAPLVGATMTDLPAVRSFRSRCARTLKPGPVSVFISRKEGRLYVRKGFEPLFDMPITIAQAQAPIGTHVFTAIAADGETARWTSVSMEAPGVNAAAALDRVTIPQDARDQISELLTAGRLADHLRSGTRFGDRQRHGLHRADTLSAAALRLRGTASRF